MTLCDWYQATIDEHPQAVGEALLEGMPGASGFKVARGLIGYHSAMLVLDDAGETCATILHGGSNGAPNAWASGERAEAFAAVLRKHWPDAHSVTRFDSAHDFRGHYPTVRDQCRALAAPRGVGGYEIAAHSTDKGSTDYLGAKTSRVQVRLYEKGKQLAAIVEDPTAIDLDWLRLEAQWRPDKVGRLIAARVSSDEVWGASPLTQAIAREVIGADPERLRPQPKPLSDFDRCHAAMIMQYGPHLSRLLVREGSPTAFLARLLVDIECR